MNDDSTIRRRSAMWPFLGPDDSPPPSAKVEVGVAAQQWRSPRHSVGDSHYAIARMTRSHETIVTSLPEGAIPDFGESAYGMVVADGTGTDGEIASRLAISTLLQYVIDFGRWNLRVNEPLAKEVADRAERFYRAVDLALLRASPEKPGALQTTLTATYSAGNELFLAHVGRSRAYMFRDGVLMPLTRDHTTSGEGTNAVVVDLATKARTSRPHVTDTLGRNGPGAPRVDVERVGLLDGDVILLCTRGLTDTVEDSRIADVLGQHTTLDDSCRALVGAAVGSGAKDDVTVLMAHYSVSGEAEPAHETTSEIAHGL